MNLAQLLTVDQIVPDMKGADRRSAISELVDHLADHSPLPSLDKTGALDLLLQREALISTGVGSGVAIPHAFLEGLEGVIVVFGRSREGIDFSSQDRAPVHFVVLFLVPKDDYRLHLQTLAAVAKLFSSSRIRQGLTEAESAGDMLAILSQRPART